MAKLKAPLLSLGASGAIGKTIVFFGWKGLDCAREYVIPSNPQTASQVTHRAILTAVVAAIHTAQAHATHPLREQDQIALSTLASAKGKIMTWFNQAVKLWVDTKVAANVPIVYRYCDLYDPDADDFACNFQIDEETGSQLADGHFWFGTSKTNLIHSAEATVTAGASVGLTAADLSAFLAIGTKYFCQFRPDVGDPCEGADSGIYSFVAE